MSSTQAPHTVSTWFSSVPREAGRDPHPKWCGPSAPDDEEADVDDVDQEEDGNRGRRMRHAEERQDGVDGQSAHEQEEERAHQAKAQPLGDGPLPPQVGRGQQVGRKQEHEPEDECGSQESKVASGQGRVVRQGKGRTDDDRDDWVSRPFSFGSSGRRSVRGRVSAGVVVIRPALHRS